MTIRSRKQCSSDKSSAYISQLKKWMSCCRDTS